jgi:protein subunit release factor A
MSDITPTDAERNKCDQELENTYKERKKLGEQCTECYIRLRKSADKGERETLKTELKKIEELCKNADKKYRILYARLNPSDDDDDRDSGPLSGDCS